MECEDRSCGETVRFSEEHLMRYLFPTEVDFLAESCGMQREGGRGVPHRRAAVALYLGRGLSLAAIGLARVYSSVRLMNWSSRPPRVADT